MISIVLGTYHWSPILSDPVTAKRLTLGLFSLIRALDWWNHDKSWHFKIPMIQQFQEHAWSLGIEQKYVGPVRVIGLYANRIMGQLSFTASDQSLWLLLFLNGNESFERETCQLSEMSYAYSVSNSFRLVLSDLYCDLKPDINRWKSIYMLWIWYTSRMPISK